MTHSNSATSLFVRDCDCFREATETEVLLAARASVARKCRRGRALTSPRILRDYLQVTLADREHEVFVIILLDVRHRVLAIEELFRGTVDAAAVYPREVVKSALKANSSAVICAHNHPSGIAEPFAADELITQRLKQALALVDIRLIDHVIIGAETVVSFSERGLL